MSTGITSFDVLDLLKPVQQCLHEMEKTLQQERRALVEQTNRDPVPQFTNEEILQSTQFLTQAVDAMQGFVNEFKKPALKRMDSQKLVQQQEKARELATNLVLLIGDKTVAFSGNSMAGDLMEIQEAGQKEPIRSRMHSLTSFLKTFGKADWLGETIASSEFENNKEQAIRILEALLNPTKLALKHSSDGTPNPMEPSEAEGDPPTSSLEHMDVLFKKVRKLKDIFEEDQRNRTNKEEQLQAKMENLNAFASILNRVPEVLNHYVLVRLCDISGNDSAVVKKWIPQEQAMEVLKMLEAFCLEATYERLRRDMLEQMALASAGRGSESGSTASSMMEYLLIQGAGAASRADGADEQGASIEELNS